MAGGLPQSIGRYRIDGVLGRGGMGIVYRGVDTETDQRVAIKTVMAESVSNQSSIRREVHSLSRLAHPGIVRIVDTGTVGAVPWYAMVLLEGRTLEDDIIRVHRAGAPPDATVSYGAEGSSPTLGEADWGQTLDLPEGASAAAVAPTIDGLHAGMQTTLAPAGAGPSAPTLDPDALDDARQAAPVAAPPSAPTVDPIGQAELERGLRIARRLMSTLAHLHSLGLVHRDIKPANIFLVNDDEPVLVDFGLSHAGATGQAREVLEGYVPAAGTPAYMAPEVIQGNPVDARADIYSAGCVIFELFAGRPPFEGPSLRALLASHMSHDAPALDATRPGIPAVLSELVAAMLQKDPARRVSHAVEAVEVLQALGQHDSDPYVAPPVGAPLYRPRLAGRRHSLSRVRACMRAVLHDKGGVTVVLGPSGIGKTYLVREAVRGLEWKIAMVPGRCAPQGVRAAGGQALHPLRELFEHLADACASDGALAARVFGPKAPILAPFNARIADLPGLGDGVEPAALEGAAQRERLVSAVVSTVLAYARERAIVIVLDDVQWADGLTLEVLQRLGDGRAESTPVRVVATCRSEERPRPVQQLLDAADVIGIEPLDRRAITEIIRDMTGSSHPDERLVDRLTELAEGSPFYVTEYLRTAHAVGLLSREGVPAGAELPDSLEALIRRRLGTLDADARLLVDLGAVLGGRHLDEEVLGRASGLDEHGLATTLHALERLQILDVNALGALQLAHDKLAESAYPELPASRRQELHGRVAGAIAQVYDDLGPHHGALAHHHEQAGHIERAVVHYEHDALINFEGLAYERASASLGKLLELGSDSMPRRDRARYAQMLGECYWSLGDIPRCEAYTLQAFDDLGERLPRSALGWLARILREAAVQGGHLAGFGVGTVDDPERIEDLRRLAVACNTLCWRYLFDDNIPYILALAISAANRVEQAQPAIPLATAHGWLAYNAGALRLHGLAARYFARAHKSAADSGDLPSAVFAILMEGLYQAGMGRFDQVVAGSQRALEMLEGQGDPQNEELHHTMLGNVRFYQGQFEASIAHFERVHALASARANAQHTAWGLYAGCWGLQALGRFEEARPRLEAARELLAKNADLPSEIITHCCLSLNALRRGDLQAARADLLACAARIDKTKVANYPTAPAYGQAVDIAVELCGHHPHDLELRRLTARLVRHTRLLVLLLPYAQPIAQRARAQLMTLRGRSRAARRLLQRSAGRADALGMRLEGARAWWLLARDHADEVPGAAAETARRLAAMGCPQTPQSLP